ncbi:ZU5 domain protein [Opisthorchis viverrini]|uniref:ZU5 domain protein n=1 Tax=Opisthorchis viverrini TaxID=6198 RepID=A0A1S8XAL5_OPIVI|nr:ZU5 domain protein [Opisthorchis viverrini]
MFGETIQSGGDWELEVDNVNIVRKPISTGFLVSFIVDARGGMLQAQRCSDLRFLIPPNAVNGPIRIVCRLLHPERVGSPPPINDGDGFACRVLEMGPVGVRFSAPIVLEIPHYAFLTEKNREVIVLRSDNGETWKEHPLDANDQAVQDTVNGYFDYVDSADELRKRSVHRILTYDLPQYFALITRVRQELILIGPEGGTLTSNVISEVQVVFPPGALQKKIRVGLQVHCIDQELVSRLLGARVLVSPIVTIEPRRRKFHKPITLKMPLPKSSTATGAGGLAAHSSVDSPSLRLLCSISGGTSPTVWEDITGSSPLSASKNTVSFTTTVSARLWLVDCPNTTEVVELASRVYHESLSVPYIGRFIVYGRRHHPEEAQIRCLCLTDDPIAKTLEQQEGFHLLATGPQVEVLDDHPHWIETAGNLVPVAKSEEQLQLNVRAFHENRLNMLVRVKDLTQPAVGKLAFTLHPRAVLQSLGIPQKRITVLEAHVPDGLSSSISGAVLKTTDIDEVTELSMSQHPDGLVNGFGVPSHKGDFSEVIGRLELDLSNVANSVGSDWPRLATVLGLSAEEQKMISSSYRTDSECAYAALIIWQDRAGIESTSGNKLAQFLHQIGRSDVVQACMSNVSPVTSPDERRIALRVLDSTEPSSVAPAVSGPFSETSGLGTSLDGVSSHIVGYDVTRPYISGQGETGADNNEMEVITPVYVERRRPEVASTTVPSRPVLGSAQHADALQEVREVFVEHEVPSTPTLSSTVEQPSIDESAIVPEYVERRIPVPSRPSVQSASPTSAPGIFGEIPESDLVEMEDALIEPVYTVPCGLNEATWGPSPFAEPERRRSDDGDKMFVSSLVEPEGLRESTWGRVQSTDHSSEDEGSAGRRLPKSPTTDLTQPPTEVVSHESDQPIASIAIPSQVPEVESGATVVVEETPVVSSLTEPLGEREATWGKPDGATENEQDQDAPCMGGEIIQPVYIEPCGLNESTWGPSPFPEHEESGSTIVGEKPLVSSPTEAVGLRQTTSGKADHPDFITSPDAATAAADIETFEDTYENVLSEILSNRSLVQQPVSLTPIPEVSEYSLLSSSLASAHPGGSWDSADFSPSASSDGRALASRRLLHQLLQQLRSSETTNPEEDISVQGSESDRVQKRSSFASSPSETGMMDPTGGSGHLRPASSHSSLLNFLRLEASCEGSRGDLSEEERQLAFGQNETSLRDLIAGLQALHKQHLDDETSSAPLESGESSLGSQLASSSGDMERRVGAVNREMLKASEASPSVSTSPKHLLEHFASSFLKIACFDGFVCFSQ